MTSLLDSSPARAQMPIQLKTLNEVVSTSFGVLAQSSFQSDTAPDKDPVIDACFRRLRFIAGGTIAKKVKFFVDSDTAYMGYHGAPGWSIPATILQDLSVTVEARDELSIDVGLLIVPVSYNSTQSAASLLGVGYSPYSFLASTSTHSRVGRDQGVQARGYVAGKHVEYRVGVFRGASKHLDGVPLRYAGRVVWYPFGAQTGLFYTGTLHGQRKLIGIGASYDHQGSYASHAADAFLEWPMRSGDSVTVQADYLRYDGGQSFLQLPRQNTWFVELGYEARRSHIGVFAQLARQDITSPTAADAAAYQSGVIWWVRANKLNVKIGVGRTLKDGSASHTQLVAQTQLFAF